jgi:hypothetical protein
MQIHLLLARLSLYCYAVYDISQLALIGMKILKNPRTATFLLVELGKNIERIV